MEHHGKRSAAAASDRTSNLSPAAPPHEVLLEGLALEREAMRLRAHIEEIRQTRSWRLTAPLRWLSSNLLSRRTAKLQFHLQLDSPGNGQTATGTLSIGGWAASVRAIEAVEILIDGVTVASCGLGLPRPDVASAHPQLVHGERSGFHATLPLDHVATGVHLLTVKAADHGGQVRQESRVIQVLPRPMTTRPRCRRFAVYAASRGNYFFHEIRDLLVAGLQELGFTVESRDERDGFSDEVDWHVVVAPHEFFYLHAGIGLVHEGLPESLILVNTEQPSTQWFARAAEYFGRARRVWDISYDSALALQSRGVECNYLALGYTPSFGLGWGREDLPVHYGTTFLEPEVRRAASAALPFDQRPIDVLFVGHATMRRERFFAHAAQTFSGYRQYLHLSSATVPVVPGQTTHLDTATVIGLVQRSKVLLNVHHGNDKYFEWHRIVMHGIWHQTLVVSEPCAAAPPFRPNVDFVEAPLEEIPAVVHELLSTTAGRQRAADIVRHGYQVLTEQCRLSDSLRGLVLDLYGAAEFPAAFLRTVAPTDRGSDSEHEAGWGRHDDSLERLHALQGGLRERTALPPLEWVDLIRRKIDLVKSVGQADSIRDYGGLWGVFGLYLIEGAKALRCSYAQMIDVTPRPEFWDKVRELHSQDPSIHVEAEFADFRETALYSRLLPVEVSLLFEVLLHQDNADEVIKNVVSRTTREVCVAQPVLKEKHFALPGGAICLQFYPEALKQALRIPNWWEEEPRVDRFDTRYWMWGQTVSYLDAVFTGYGCVLQSCELYELSDHWDYALLRFTMDPSSMTNLAAPEFLAVRPHGEERSLPSSGCGTEELR